MTPIDVPGGEYPDQDLRRSTPATRRLSGTVREQKEARDRQTEARITAKVAKVTPPAEDPDIAALRAQAQEDRELAASARRRAEAARART